MTTNLVLRRTAIIVGIALGLFALLIVGGWAFLCGIGALFAFGYRRTANQGYMIAGATFIGLGIGVGIELALKREGGVAMMIGLGLGFLSMAIIVWLESRKIEWWAAILGIVLFALTAVLWSFSMDKLQLFLSVFPFGILVLLVYAGYEFWKNRKLLKAV